MNQTRVRRLRKESIIIFYSMTKKEQQRIGGASFLYRKAKRELNRYITPYSDKVVRSKKQHVGEKYSDFIIRRKAANNRRRIREGN